MLWRYTNKEIRGALDKLFKGEWVDFYRPSGLYIWVTMDDGSEKTVYDHEIREVI